MEGRKSLYDMLLMRKKGKVCPYFFFQLVILSFPPPYKILYTHPFPHHFVHSHMCVYAYVLRWFQFKMRNGYKIEKKNGKEKVFIIYFSFFVFCCYFSLPFSFFFGNTCRLTQVRKSLSWSGLLVFQHKQLKSYILA